jgi:GH15 family glucan-1,4-alpha-glucosidase
MEQQPYIGDYSLIGNCRGAALVSRYGSIDWCCLPEFHSPAIFAALLDSSKGGCFAIKPTDEFTSMQKYIQDTNVVETCFETRTGQLQLLDMFVAMEEDEKIKNLFPDHEVLRVVECTSGEMEISITYRPTLHYGKQKAQLKNNQKLGIQFTAANNMFILQSTMNLRWQVEDHKATANILLRAGDSITFSLSCSTQCPAIIPEINTTAAHRVRCTINYWKQWIATCTYTGVFDQAVRRSALTLKLLSHAPSGAVIAAPTTSLPELIGGGRNWDYRYCWLRDASFTIRALIKLGFYKEAHAYINWILHATQLTQPKLQVVYTVFGNSKIKETVCDWLSGYKNSVPVRIGNAADGQFQLDVYGEVLDAIYTYSEIVQEFDRTTRKFITGIGDVICKIWNKPDDGIWEIRSDAVHHTHSKAMAMIGLQRVVKLARKYNWNVPVAEYEKTIELIREQIEQQGFNTELKTYTREFNGSSADASLLQLPLVDYCEASSLRMLSTSKFTWQQLSKNGLLYRYRSTNDGLQGDEGAFIVCGFWYIQNLAKSGDIKTAMELFKKVLEHASPSGLLSEEIDPQSKELLGNYPQAFSHIGLINAALSIDEACANRIAHGN